MKKLPIHNIIVVILLALLMGGATLFNLGAKNKPLPPGVMNIRYILVGGSLFLLMLLSRFRVLRFPRRASGIILVWELFATISIISAAANGQSLLDGLWFLIGVPVFFFNIVPTLIKKQPSLFIISGFLLGHIPYIVVSLLTYPLVYPYQGVMGGPNPMAVMAAGIFACGLSLWSGIAVGKRSVWSLILILSLLATFTLAVICGNRSSIAAMFVMFLCFLWLNAERLGTIRATTKLLLPVVVVIVASLYLLGEGTQRIAGGIAVKTSIQIGNLLPVRFYIWSTTIREMTLLGHGKNYFLENFRLGPHNSIIGILGESGIVAALLMVGFAIITTISACKYSKLKEIKDRYNQFPLLIMLCFWIESMAEGLFGSLGRGLTIAFYITTGVVIMRHSNAPATKQKKSAI